jgi:hypothetical protein
MKHAHPITTARNRAAKMMANALMIGKSAMVPNVSTAASEIPVARYANSGNALTHSHSDSAL